VAWFHRSRKNIEEQNSREMPDGLWMKCSGCDHIIYKGELEEHLSTCSQCNKHFRIKANDYLNLLFDNESFIESDKDVTPGDPLNFSDEISYVKRYEQAVQKTGLKEAITIGTGFVDGKKISIAAMDFSFIGGSMMLQEKKKFHLLPSPLLVVLVCKKELSHLCKWLKLLLI
jgi:acetyl-CoA carboxylase carboxyl transferase subunit beta